MIDFWQSAYYVYHFLLLFTTSTVKITWKSHIDCICKIIARNIGFINRMKHFFPGPVLDSLYNTLVVSYINYGILAWGGSSSKNFNRLLLLQKRTLRIINFSEFNAHTDPLFLKHKTLKLKDIYYYQLGSLMYQFTSNNLPYSIKSIFFRNCEIHSYFTRQASNFHIPYTRTSFAHKTVKHEGPMLWNSFTGKLKSSKNIYTFKRIQIYYVGSLSLNLCNAFVHFKFSSLPYCFV